MSIHVLSPDVWAVWPTVNIEQSQNMILEWKGMGYQVAVLVNHPHTHDELSGADRVIVQDKWEGFPVAANILCRETPGDIVVVVGDDVYPEPRKDALELGERFLERFPDLFGVAQPTGDKYGCWDKCAVSPWIGRRFIELCYDGTVGPYRPEYYHYFSDEELQAYAMELKAFEQWDDVVQYHDHWQRGKNQDRPKYLREAKRRWSQDRWTFKCRSSKGFPCQSKA